MFTIEIMWKTYSHAFWQSFYNDLNESEMSDAHGVNANYYQSCLQNRLDSKGIAALLWLLVMFVVVIVATLWHVPSAMIVWKRYNRMQKLFKTIWPS